MISWARIRVPDHTEVLPKMNYDAQRINFLEKLAVARHRQIRPAQSSCRADQDRYPYQV